MAENSYPALIATLDLSPEVKLLSRRPWHQAEISLYQLLYWPVRAFAVVGATAARALPRVARLAEK
jgi:hypothetical protein